MTLEVQARIPGEIPGQAPRKSARQHELAKLQFAADAARQEIVDFVVTGGEDPLALAQDPVLAEGEDLQSVPAHHKKTPRTIDVARRVENHNVNNVMKNPHVFRRITEGLVGSIVSKGRRFAQTLRNKGQLDPAVEEALGIKNRKSAKATILERAK